MNNEEFNKIFETIGKSNTSVPSHVVLSILAGIVNTSGSDSEEIKKFAELVKDEKTEDIVSKTVLFTCNSVIMNLWKMFGPQFEEAYKKTMAEQSEKKDA